MTIRNVSSFSKKDPFTQIYMLRINFEVIEEIVEKSPHERKKTKEKEAKNQKYLSDSVENFMSVYTIECYEMRRNHNDECHWNDYKKRNEHFLQCLEVENNESFRVKTTHICLIIAVVQF